MNKENKIRPWKTSLVITAVVFSIFLLQHYFRRFGQSIDTIYFTILFDSIALTGVVTIGISYLLGPLARLWPKVWVKTLSLRKSLGLIGLALVVFHVFLALTVFNPSYFSKMFVETGKLSTVGELSILAGVAGLVLLLIVGTTSLPSVEQKMEKRLWMMIQRMGLIALIISVLHFVVLKWRGWFNLDNWHNGIPSGTLVTTTFIVFVILMRLLARFSKK